MAWVHTHVLAHGAVCLGEEGLQKWVFGRHGRDHGGGFVAVDLLPLLVLLQYLVGSAALDAVLYKDLAMN